MNKTGGGLTQKEIKRYSRHIILPEVGMEGQEALLDARVLLIGAGGLGSSLALYLSAAGVGTIGLVDFDVVEYSNLQRQIIHGTSDVGRPKIVSAENTIKEINPGTKIIKYETMISSANAISIIKDFDYVIDGTDNFPTRYLVNDACVMLGKTNIYGSIYRFDGQATVFKPKEGPCYRCLYPKPPPPGLIPSCQEGGVIGVLPGTIGLIQATETIKLIVGAGSPLIGRLLLYDAMDMSFDEVLIERDHKCPVCGDKPTITALEDYNEFCGVRTEVEESELTSKFNISVEEAYEKLRNNKDGKIVLLDVREPNEVAICKIENSEFIPSPLISDEAQNLDMSKEYLILCKVGKRSLDVAKFLFYLGFKKVHNIKGGILKWADKIDNSLKKY